MTPQIRIDDLNSPLIQQFLREHLQDMALHSPPESVHALGTDALRQPGITFWAAWEGAELMGCGALKALDATHAEIKSMRTSPTHRGKGVARAVLNHMLQEAMSRSYARLSLETGPMKAFEPARKLYESCGFEYCEPFSDYGLDPYSVYMTKTL